MLKMKSSLKSIKACAAYYGPDAPAVEKYLKAGEKKALKLGNRGPISFNSQGLLSKDIIDAYSKFGFYILATAMRLCLARRAKYSSESNHHSLPCDLCATLGCCLIQASV